MSKLNAKQFGQKLIKIAKNSVKAAVKGEEPPNLEIDDPRLEQKLGVFVTLHRRGRLRGCIGLIESDLPLWKGVQKMAKSAALDDPRFPPVTYDELKDLRLEVSVLSQPKQVLSPEEVEAGKHGVIMKQGFRRGVFLPQVAQEQGYDREQFLSSLCTHKLGLPSDAWKNDDVQILTFTAQVFFENDDDK